ncbi:MAG: DUF3267 domain-containing protein, partial [Eubacteriales bacterium]
EEIFALDLKKDKKMALAVNLLALAIMLAAGIPMNFVVPILTLFDMDSGVWLYFLRFAVMLAGIVAYIILHELVHGAAMKLFGAEKVHYGFNGIFAWAGSDDYFDKKSYIAVALAPVVLWGAVLAVICALVPESWFWVVYLIQIANISGAAGDFYVTARLLRFPGDVRISDNGLGMRVYSAEKAERT